MSDQIPWDREEPPRVPRLAFAQNEAATRLVERLLAEPDEVLQKLSGVGSIESSERMIAVLGMTQDLPWIDGVRYFGEVDAAPGVYLPTTRTPRGPLALLIRALRKTAPKGPLIWLEDGRVIPLSASRSLHRAQLEAWNAP
ncbi:MAG: hypothetical protein AAFV29_22030 [Myxococcota bacterium]